MTLVACHISFFMLKQNEFNSDALSNAVTNFFHIFVIVLLVECEKNGDGI